MPSTTQALPSRIEDLPFRDLKGLVEREDPSLSGVRHAGGFADIYIGYLTEGGCRKKVAIKVLRMANRGDVAVQTRKSLIRETAAWHKLRHRNVLEFLGLAPDHGRYGCPALIAPYCDQGTAKEYLAKSTRNLDTKLFIIRGVAEGLKYLHDNQVVHGDLKPSNVLIHDDGRPLLCDFGRSKILTSGGFTTRADGHCRYQAPELLMASDGPNKTSDIYAFATTSYEFWTGVEPFHEIHQDSSIIISIVMSEARPEYPESAPIGTELLWEIFEDSWKSEPHERINATELEKRLRNMSEQLTDK